MFLLKMDWLTDLGRTISHWLDRIVYEFIPKVYDLFINIANTTIFTEDIIDMFASKVYALLGIFMLFKVSFSILTYITNPDDFTDKNKGFSKLISNIVITLTLLVATPWIFSQAMDIQRIVLKDNIIGRIFTAGNGTEFTLKNISSGNIMAYETYKAFYHVDFKKFPECENMYTNTSLSQSACELSIGKTNLNTILGYDNRRDINGYINDDDLLNAKIGDNYLMYNGAIISTIVGVVVLLLLTTFCFDIALRSIKLGFLRMISPVPIVSRIDPKKGKDLFGKWTKECLSTYLDLFMRLIAVYFAIYIVTLLPTMRVVDATTGVATDTNQLVKVFIIIGALLFAKQLPKLVEDLLGIKTSGKFTLNPLKKAAEVPLLGKASNLAIGGIDSQLHGNGFVNGVRRNWTNLGEFIKGGDGKTSIFDTADRRMRKEIRKKRFNDTAMQHYEGLERQRQYKKQYADGEGATEIINAAKEASEKQKVAQKEYDIAKNDYEANKTEENRRRLTAAERNLDKAKSESERYQKKADKVYTHQEFVDSKKSVDAAKALMYAWRDEVGYAESELNRATTPEEKAAAMEKYKEAQKQYGTAQGQYEYRKKLHDAVRQTYSDDAKVEDNIEAYEKSGGKVVSEPPKHDDAILNDSSSNSNGSSSNSNNSQGASNGSSSNSNNSQNGSNGSSSNSNNSQGGSNGSSSNSNNSQGGSNGSSSNSNNSQGGSNGSSSNSNNSQGGSNGSSNNSNNSQDESNYSSSNSNSRVTPNIVEQHRQIIAKREEQERAREEYNQAQLEKAKYIERGRSVPSEIDETITRTSTIIDQAEYDLNTLQSNLNNSLDAIDPSKVRTADFTNSGQLNAKIEELNKQKVTLEEYIQQLENYRKNLIEAFNTKKAEYDKVCEMYRSKYSEYIVTSDRRRQQLSEELRKINSIKENYERNLGQYESDINSVTSKISENKDKLERIKDKIELLKDELQKPEE